MVGIWGFLVCFMTLLGSEGAEELCNSHRLYLKSGTQEQVAGLVSYLSQVLTTYWHTVWVSNWRRSARAQRKGAAVILFCSLEIATVACSLLLFFSLIIAHVSLNRPVPPRGIPEFLTTSFSDWKSSPRLAL